MLPPIFLTAAGRSYVVHSSLFPKTASPPQTRPFASHLQPESCSCLKFQSEDRKLNAVRSIFHATDSAHRTIKHSIETIDIVFTTSYPRFTITFSCCLYFTSKITCILSVPLLSYLLRIFRSFNLHEKLEFNLQNNYGTASS